MEARYPRMGCRLPVYLSCSSNNRANTVLSLFREAFDTYGLPSHTRIDQGGAHVDVSMFPLTHPMCGPGQSSVIVSKSVHNHRVERLWRDVYQGVLGFYHGLFKHLEVVGALGPNDEIHLFVFTSSIFLESTDTYIYGEKHG